MASRPKLRYTSAEKTKLILVDNDENSDNFSLSSNFSYRDSDEYFEQAVLPPCDSDEPCSNVSSSETKSDEDGNLKVFFNTAYHATKDPAAKWIKYLSAGAGRPKAQDILQESGPSNHLSTSIASPKDAFDLISRLTLFIKFLNSVTSVQHFCQQYLQSSAVNRFHGYQPFTIDEILTFIGLQLIVGASKMGSQSLPDLFTSI